MSTPYTDATPLPKKTYGAAESASDAASPLLGPSSSASASASGARANANAPSNAWMDTPDGELPDDFKVGVAVADCDAVIRLAFVRKVYAILFVQLALTSAVSVAMRAPAVTDWTRANAWFMWVPVVGSLVSLGGVWWKRHEHPANLIILGVFTLFESLSIGLVTSFTESRIVVQALLITLGVFTGLTLFTFQTKLDFSSLYPFLSAALFGLITTSLVSLFLPFNSSLDLFIAGFSTLLFSGFVLYDTQMIMKRLSVDEAILGALTLYLDFLNLFLSILRILNNQNRD
ncbi:hypothetical protein Q5752_000191 [Cryptotrichosporon argae]